MKGAGAAVEVSGEGGGDVRDGGRARVHRDDLAAPPRGGEAEGAEAAGEVEHAPGLTVGGKPTSAPAHCITRLPANVPHALDAGERTRMLLVMLRDPAP